MPCKKVAVNAIFCCNVTFSCHISGIGKASITMPLIAFGRAVKRAYWILLMHVPDTDKSQFRDTGVHWKMEPNTVAKPVATTIKLTA